MIFNSKRLYLHTALALGAGYLLSFIIYYVSNYLLANDFTAYLWLFTNKLCYLLMPMAAAVVLFICSGYDGAKRAIPLSIPFALVRSVYFIPYYYLQYIAMGYDSIESLSIGLAISLLEAALSFGIMLLFFAVLKLICERMGKCSSGELLPKKTALDFSDPVAIALAAISAAASLYFIVGEIVDTVAFFAEYGSTVTLPELIYTVVSYIFDILIAPIYFFLLAAIKNRIVEMRLFSTDSAA